MKKISLIVALIVLIGFVSIALAADVYVRPYYRSDGTYVQGHYRTAPDNSRWNNYSTKGNVNPYTGERGYEDPSSSYSPSPSLLPSYQSPSRKSIYHPRRWDE